MPCLTGYGILKFKVGAVNMLFFSLLSLFVVIAVLKDFEIRRRRDLNWMETQTRG